MIIFARLGIYKFHNQAFIPVAPALTMNVQILHFLSTSSESYLKHSGSKTVPYLPE